MITRLTLEETISMFEKKILDSDYVDSVHKIKIMTTIEMLKKLRDEINKN